MKFGCLFLVMTLVLNVACAVTFEQARPVWPAASDGLPNENMRFAASFEVNGGPLVLKATGATQYKIRLDGETVGWGPARAPEGWARVSEIPLAVAKGRHTLTFEVTAYNIRQFYCNIPQPAYLQAELVDADGKVVAATGKDGAFKATPISARHRVTARFSTQRGFVECWTLPERDEAALALAERPAKRLTVRRAPEPDLSAVAQMKLVGEQKVRFDPDAGTQDWFFVKDEFERIDLGYPLTNHVWDAYRHAQKFVALENVRPVADAPVGHISEGVRLRYDLGADLTGFVGMKVKVIKPGKLWLNWSELLVNGKVNSFKMRNADISVWEFTEAGEYVIETIEPYTLRYLEATSEGGAFELSAPGLRRLESPEVAAVKLPRTGDAELDEILAAAKLTVAENTLDTFMDCPGRERAAWLCDAFFTAKGAFALVGNTKVEKDFLENWLLPDSFGDLPEGMLPMTYPSSATSGEFIPNWAMWYVLQLEDYLKRSGDRAFVDAMKPRMEKLIRFFRQYRNADGLLEKLPSWVFVEWSAANEYVQDVNYPANMTWAGVLESYGRMYGDAEAKAEAADVRKAIFAQSFDGQFFRDHARRWADGTLTVMPECTETCQDYALFFRFGDKTTPGDWYDTVVNNLGGARPYGSDILPEISRSTPFIGCALRVLALSELGETEALKRDVKAFFLEQARRTGTLWETEREVNSNCHGFAGVVADILLRLQSVNCTPPAAFRSFKPAIAPGKVKVCMDWDDSCFTDFRLAELCRKYKAKATFNITPRAYSDHCYMRRETTERNGTTFRFKSPEGFDRAQTVSIPYLTNKDFKYCYEGFKIAAHLNFPTGDSAEELGCCRQLMEEFLSIAPSVTGQDGFGIVWSGGRWSPGIVKLAKELGFRYCRGANTYEKPGKWGEWTIQPTTYWSEPPEKFWEWYEFAKKRGDVFWFWGHTQDLGYDDAIWARLEGIIKRISEDPDAEWIDVGDLAKEADSNRPQTWFHLIGGNVSKEGIVRDLDAIAEAGIGGVQFFHGQFGGAWPHVAEQIPCLSGKWDDIVRFTATEAKRRGLSFTLQNCPGWSYAGGPWVPVERSMRVLDATRTDVRGGAVDAVLPKPAYPADKDDTRTDFRDLKVIAFPKLAGEAAAVRPVDFKPVHFADTNSPVELRYDLGREMTVRSIVFDNPRQMCWCWQSNPVLRIELFAETAAGEAKIGDWNLPMMIWQDRETLTLPIAATTFRRCRFRFTYKSALHLDGVSFLGEARYRSWESEAGYSHRELMKGDEPASVAGEAVDPKTVINLTDKMDASGRLVATLPPGEWTILRIGHASNGHTNAPAPKEATGFECDKFSAEAARRHFAAYTGRLAAKGAPLDGRLDGVLVDSWECGFQNWTADGLDVRTADWPALFGYVVGDRAATRAFFRDWRNQLSARVNAGFYRTTADLIRSVGGKFWCEVGPGEVFPGDPMEYFKYADVPMCEFWLPFAKAGEQVFDRPNERYSAACVSAAHVYGKRRVAAESFTSCVTWNEDFKLMKEMMDAFFSLGVTYPVFHTYTHNPATDLPPPGTSFGEGAFGCPFLRGQTWWPYMRHFTDYLTRCTALLERGVPANDVLMYLGDDVNALPRTSEDGTWEHPAGFVVDYLNRDALMNRLAFRDGRVVSPEGAAWRAIWIPEGTYLAPETERRLAEAERAGIPVKRGGGTVAAFLAAKGLAKDFDEPTGKVRHIHRRDGAKDIYFVCVNRKSGGFSGPVGFGAKGKAAVYDPVRDTRTPWDGRTLSLAPGGSAFVIFGEDGADGAGGAGGVRALPVREIKSWTLSFPAGWCAPEKLAVEKLVPWCELPVSEEAKAFSGTVTYRAKFRGKFAKIDLGRVETIAEVKVNGKDAGVLWCEPYVADVKGLCTDGENELEIAVTSTWHNRLLYDATRPEAERKTWTLPYPKNLSAGRLLPYGLMENAK